MAKVKKEIIGAAALKLLQKINQTLPSNSYKFILGGAAGMLSISGLSKINQALDQFTDENGLVETNQLREIYASAFNAADGKLQIDLFNNQGSLLSMFVKPLTVTITKDDIDELMREVEQHAVVTEVQLSNTAQISPQQQNK